MLNHTKQYYKKYVSMNDLKFVFYFLNNFHIKMEPDY